MRKTFILIAVILTVGGLFLFTQRDRGFAQSADAKIKSAMSAAPPSIAKDATIMDLAIEAFVPKAGVAPPILRQGTNGWICFPDDPSNPANDPMCLDKMWMEWYRAIITGTKPNITTLGISYMLQGGAAPNMTSPAPSPASKDQWVLFPPHIMLVQPDRFDPKVYATEFKGKAGPWLVFAGTPYEFLVMPVVDPAQ